MFTILMCSGAKSKMEKNILEADSNILRNRQLMLQNAMADQWPSVREERQDLTNVLGDFWKSRSKILQNSGRVKVFRRPICSKFFPI